MQTTRSTLRELLVNRLLLKTEYYFLRRLATPSETHPWKSIFYSHLKNTSMCDGVAVKRLHCVRMSGYFFFCEARHAEHSNPCYAPACQRPSCDRPNACSCCEENRGRKRGRRWRHLVLRGGRWRSKMRSQCLRPRIFRGSRDICRGATTTSVSSELRSLKSGASGRRASF